MFHLCSEQQRLQNQAKELADKALRANAAEIDRSEAYPWDNVALLRDAGFMGMTLPKAYGGRGLTYFDAVLVIEQIARACGVSARIVVEANMGAVGAIMAYGTERQKTLCAPYVLEGDKPAICITEPDAGSAATDMTTTAVKKGDIYILNGKKHWITGGGVSQLHLIFAKIVEEGKVQGIGAFIAIRGEHTGLIVGEREPTMGLRGIPETQVIFDNLEISQDMALPLTDGSKAQAAKHGFGKLMSAYNGQRVGAATVAHGIAQGAYEAALAYAKKRRQFDRPIAEFQGLQWMLADMATQLSASQALIYKAAYKAGPHFPDMNEAAQAKIFASDMAIKVTNDALQIHGAMGYSRNLPLERMARDARMFTIGGGTGQMLRNQVASSILEMKLSQRRDGYSSQLQSPKKKSQVLASDTQAIIDMLKNKTPQDCP